MKKMVCGVLLTQDEIDEAYYYLYDHVGLVIELWEESKIYLEIANYWKDRGKESLEE